MNETILFISCIFITTFMGWNVFFLLTNKSPLGEFSIAETIGFSYFLGFGTVTIEMFIIGMLGFEFTKFNIIVPWIPIILLNAFLFWKKNRKIYIEPKKAKRYTYWELILLALVSLQTVYNLLRALLKPIESYDSVAIYALKAKMLYLDHGISGEFFSNVAQWFHGAHPDYPLFIPLSETWVYTFLNGFNDIIVKLIFPLFYLSFIFIFYSILNKATKNRKLAIIFTFLLATVKQFSDYSTIGVCDMELGMFFFIAIACFYLWTKDRNKSYFLNLSLAATALCVWTKNEGMLLALIAAVIVIAYMILYLKILDNRSKIRLLLYCAITFIFILLWTFFKKYHNLVNDNFTMSMMSPTLFLINIKKIPVILYEYQKQFFGIKKWNIIWILWIIIWIRNFKESFRGTIGLLTASFLLFSIGYSLVYIFSTVEINYFLTTTASRFLLHILPVTIFWMALIIKRDNMVKL